MTAPGPLASLLARLRVEAATSLHRLADLAGGEELRGGGDGSEPSPRGGAAEVSAPGSGGAALAPHQAPVPASPVGGSGGSGEGGGSGPLSSVAPGGGLGAARREEAERRPVAGAATGGHTTPEARAAQESAARGVEEWAYAVWRALGASEDIVGVHAGGARAWRGIAERLPGRTYYGSGARLRRYATPALAVAAYEAEASRHGAALPPRRFYW